MKQCNIWASQAKDGYVLLDDGLQCVAVLQKLQQASEEEFATFSRPLQEALMVGISCTEVSYLDSGNDREVRVMWQTVCHDLDSNRFKPSSLLLGT